ncbi:MAG: nucleotide exchange factor GrpE [Fimbriimonadaceae bacterium]
MKHPKKPLTEEIDPPEAGTQNTEVEDASDVEFLKAALLAAQDDRDQLRDQLMRSVADFQNFRKRNEADKALTRQFANEKLVLELLPVLDNFERTFAALQSGSSLESIMGGIQAVDRQLRAVLESYNVVRIPAHGEAFDPEIHEAVATDPSDEHPENTVLQELEPGYKMADKVIRPARVRVSTKT